MGWLIGILSFIGGSMFGVVFMCMFQINRTYRNKRLEE